MPNQKNILCIEDSIEICELITALFKGAGYKAVTTSMPKEGIQLARDNDFAAIILGNRFNVLEGADLCREIRTFDSKTPIIFFTGEARAVKRQAALEAGAQAYLIKPNDFRQLEQTVTELINKSMEEPLWETIKRTDFGFVESKNYRLNGMN